MKRKGLILGVVATLTILTAAGFGRLDRPRPGPATPASGERRELLETMWRLQDKVAYIYDTMRNATVFHRFRREVAQSAQGLLDLTEKAKVRGWKADDRALPKEVWDRLTEDCRREADAFVRLMTRPAEPSQAEAKRAFTALTDTCYRCHRESLIRH